MDQEKQVRVARLLNQFLRDEAATADEFVSRQTQDVQGEAQEAVGILNSIIQYSAVPAPSDAGRRRMARAMQQRRRERNLAELKEKAKRILFQNVQQYAKDLVGADLVLNRSTQIINAAPQNWKSEKQNQSLWDQQAREAAAEITREMQEAGIYQLPIDPKQVAEYLGILVQEFPLPDRDGCLFRNGDMIVALLNNLVPDERRKRFTCAHEIGHSVLHKDVSLFEDNNISARNYSDIKERQAHIFASYLLAPSHEVKPLLHDPPCIQQAEDIQARFNISLAAALVRVVSDTDWDCALVASHFGTTQWTFLGEHFDGYIVKGHRLPLSSAARSLEDKSIVGTESDTVIGGQWTSNDTWFHEESKRSSSGWIYTLLIPVDPS